MFNSRDCTTASSVRLGVAMLKVTMGVGRMESDVKDDMVMPRGVGVVDSPLDTAVHTTTECGRRRITERSCSGRGRVSCGSGWTEGDVGGENFQSPLLFEGRQAVKVLCAKQVR